MSYSEEELKKQGAEIDSKLALVFVPIFIMCAIILIIQNNSIDHNRKIYLEDKHKAFYGVVVSKKEDGDYPRARRYVILNNGRKITVTNEIYREIGAGDSLVKEPGKDTVYFYLGNGAVLVDDYCKYSREKYIKLINK